MAPIRALTSARAVSLSPRGSHRRVSAHGAPLLQLLDVNTRRTPRWYRTRILSFPVHQNFDTKSAISDIFLRYAINNPILLVSTMLLASTIYERPAPDQGYGRGGTPNFTGVFEPLARVALYPTDEDGLGTWFGAA